MPGKTKIKSNDIKSVQKPINKPPQQKVQSSPLTNNSLQKPSVANTPPQNKLQSDTGISKPVQQKTVEVKKEQPKLIPQPVYNPNSPEMLKYKNNLRAKLFSKFAVGGIQGNGECSIEFTVSQNGKLENRKFSSLSENKSLNDTVYYMLMSVPYFEVPPKSYNGETIHMKFKMYNGNYEITIN